jgi:hypothetical protein
MRVRRVLPIFLVAAALVLWALPASADDEPVVPEGPVPAPAISQIAQAIAGAFQVVVDEIQVLHQEDGIGFGAIYRLALIAQAQGITVDELLGSLTIDENGQYEFGFGQLFKNLGEDELLVLGSFPRNLGQLIASLNRADGQGNDGNSADHGNSGNHGPHSGD